MDAPEFARAAEQPWFVSEEYFNATFQDRIAGTIGRAIMDAHAANIRADMANAKAGAYASRLGEIEKEVADLAASKADATPDPAQ